MQEKKELIYYYIQKKSVCKEILPTKENMYIKSICKI